MPNYDDMSLSEIFKLDASERIKSLNGLILKLEKDQGNDVLYDDMMREAHSLKAAARIINNKDIQALAHKMEEILSYLKQKKCLNADHVDLFFEVLDSMSKMIDAFIAQKGHDVDIEELIRRLDESKENNKSQKLTEKADIRKPEGSDSSKRKISVEKGMVENDMAQLAVRINIEQLDKLMKLSGEIYTHTINLDKERERLSLLSEHTFLLEKDYNNLKILLKEEGGGVKSNRFSEWVFKNQSNLTDFQSNLKVYLEKLDYLSVSFTDLGIQLQGEVMASRMLPAAAIFDQHLRFVRDMARESGKKISLNIEGGDTPIDRSVLQVLKDPLTHLVRNACDHGIELPIDRLKANKKEEGQVILKAYHKSDRVMIIVEDDGQGIDWEALREKAIEKGLISKEKAEQLSEEEILNFIYLHGFSTTQRVTSLSGRGVGLDVVKKNIGSIGGQISLETDPGKLTRFILSLPLTLAVTKVLLVKSGREIFGIPITRAEEVCSISSQEVKSVEGRETLDVRGEIIPVVYLATLWDLEIENVNLERRHLVIVSDGRDKLALWVDQYLEEKEIVCKPLDRRLGHWKDITGATVLDNGQVAFIVDTESIIQSSAEYTGRKNAGQEHQQKIIARKRILVVEDSLTVRELERKVLQNHGYDVEIAVDGLEGFNKIKENKFDLIVTDIEMPRMDGFEMISLIKRDEKLKDIPTIILSFKEREEDKRRGMEVGADKYITKSKYDDEILLDAIAKLIG